MSFESEFDELMNDTVTIQPRSSTNSYGQRTWGSSTSYTGRVSFQTRLMRGADGRERVSSGRVYLRGAYAISTDAKLTLPSGATPVISSVETFSDEDGAHHTTVHFE